jgi:hypothetical protein
VDWAAFKKSSALPRASARLIDTRSFQKRMANIVDILDVYTDKEGLVIPQFRMLDLISRGSGG